MRCNNCGWDNDPGAGTCVKCGHVLQSVDSNYRQDPYRGVNVPNYNRGEANPAPRPTVLNSQSPESMPRPTVLNSQRPDPVPRPTRIVNANDLREGAANPAGPKTPANCPQCGYPLASNTSSCPNCGAIVAEEPASTKMQNFGAAAAPVSPIKVSKSDLTEFDIAEEVKCDNCGAMVSIEFSFCPKCGERIHLPTVRAIKHKPQPAPEPPKPHCHLTLIPEEGEITEAVKNTYEGDSIILNRENTEPGNRTITSKEQAELICEEGQWFVLNHSELGSTYIEANRKFALEPGDVIVLGDRRFKFETE
ncbi:MAG: zinc ribbon domain-containing protein [Prevotella sp.]|nr:zinc ribbon domain-containing protein [Prevotella sp.]